MVNGTAEVREIPLVLEPRDVWAALGNPDKVLPTLSPDIDECIALAHELCEPRGLYRWLTIDEVGRKGITFKDGPPLEGKFLAHCFEGGEEAVFVLLTIGPALEKRVSEMFADGDTVEAFKIGTPGAETIPQIARYGDRITTVMGKKSFDAFTNTNLASYLREQGVERILFAGCVTSLCVNASSLHAFDAGFDVTILSDCTSSRTPVEQDFFCKNVFPLFAEVTTSAAMLGLEKVCA